jgi:hypothetical protein
MSCGSHIHLYLLGVFLIACGPTAHLAQAEGQKPATSAGVVIVEHDKSVFRDDPDYDDQEYDATQQREIYGGKKAIDAPRPLLEIGNPMYRVGPLHEGNTALGRKNPLAPSFLVYGEMRMAVAANDNGDVETGLVATRLDLEFDAKLTSTERFHAQIRPLDQAGKNTRYEFAGENRDLRFERVTDLNLETFFFEGDLGNIYSGIADEYASFDLPVSVGLIPLLFQNGVWVDDKFIGGAFAIPARNSPALDISNMDITFFGAIDKVTTPAIRDRAGNLADHGVSLYGANVFVEANSGYWEAGIGTLVGQGGFDELEYNSATLAFTRRYGGWLSNSIRGIWTFGQDRGPGGAQQTADGMIFLLENSFFTSLPSTLVPYMNLWIGFDRPQPLADDTGILKNTGITFETDNLTGFPKLDDTGHDTYGGAIGLQYLFNLDRQLVFELSTVQVMGGIDVNGRAARDDQYGVGIRYQMNLDKAWLLRADAMYGVLRSTDDISGARLELRRKF